MREVLLNSDFGEKCESLMKMSKEYVCKAGSFCEGEVVAGRGNGKIKSLCHNSSWNFLKELGSCYHLQLNDGLKAFSLRT